MFVRSVTMSLLDKKLPILGCYNQTCSLFLLQKKFFLPEKILQFISILCLNEYNLITIFNGRKKSFDIALTNLSVINDSDKI